MVDENKEVNKNRCRLNKSNSATGGSKVEIKIEKKESEHTD